MRIWIDDEWKIVFQTWYGYFEYKIILFGFSNTFASFKDYVNTIPAKKLNVFIIVYLSDILIYIKNTSQDYL